MSTLAAVVTPAPVFSWGESPPGGVRYVPELLKIGPTKKRANRTKPASTKATITGHTFDPLLVPGGGDQHIGIESDREVVRRPV